MESSNRPNEQAHQELYEAGIEMRRKVMGNEYVNNQLKTGVSEFMKPMQELTTEVLLGMFIHHSILDASSPLGSMGDYLDSTQVTKSGKLIYFDNRSAGLEPKQRSLIVIALLASQGKAEELAGHVRGAIGNGATELEIRETLLQAAIYCGIPTGMTSFRIAEETLKKMKAE